MERKVPQQDHGVRRASNHRISQETQSQAAALGGPRAATRRNSPGEEDATWNVIGEGFIPCMTLLVLFWPADASTDELLQLAN